MVLSVRGNLASQAVAIKRGRHHTIMDTVRSHAWVLFDGKISCLQVWRLCCWSLCRLSILILPNGSRLRRRLSRIVLPTSLDNFSARCSRAVEMCVNQAPRTFVRTHIAVDASLERVLSFQKVCESIGPGVHRDRRR